MMGIRLHRANPADDIGAEGPMHAFQPLGRFGKYKYIRRVSASEFL